MWWLSVLALTANMLLMSWRAGPRFGLGSTVVLSLLVPTWVIELFAGFPVHVRFTATVAALGIYCVHPASKLTFRLSLIDLAGLALVAVHLASDWMNEGFNWFVPLRAYGEWFVPYVAGRLAFQSVEDVRRMLPVAGGVAILLAAGGITESLTRVDVWPRLFGPPPLDAPPPLDTLRPEAERWGVRRANGPTMNPNFFGLLQLLLFPWVMYAATRAARGRATAWWGAAPFICAAGILSPLSRSAQAGLLILMFVQAAVLWPRLRPILIGGTLAAVVGAALLPNVALSALRAWGGETAPRKTRWIQVEGERIQASNALYRVHLLAVYRTAAERAGPLGFGTEAVTSFPVNVPLGQVDHETAQYLRFVDNAYLLMVLRFGYLGLTCFTVFGILAAGTFILMARARDIQGRVFYAAAGGACTAVLLMLLTVWMPQDFGFCFLWTAGIASGLVLHAQVRGTEQVAGQSSERLMARSGRHLTARGGG